MHGNRPDRAARAAGLGLHRRNLGLPWHGLGAYRSRFGVAGEVAIPSSTTAQRFGHPAALAVLAGTELWERISFHGMAALLTLYMAEQLLLPGHVEAIAGYGTFRAAVEWATGTLSPVAMAAQVFGLYMGLVNFTPILGGYLGDRWLGRRRAVAAGAALMTLGHLCLAFDRTFLVALLLLIGGAGLLRGNLVAQLGALYPPGDTRAATGVQIYYAMVNIGYFIGPLLTGLLAKLYGWHWGFAFAGLGMLTGLALYLAGTRQLADTPGQTQAARRRLTVEERRTCLKLLALLPLITLFWVDQVQYWNAYNFWVRDYVDLTVLGWRMPVPWVQSLAGLCATLPVPLVLAFWAALARRGLRLTALQKLAFGCVGFGLFTCWDASATLIFGTAGAIPLLWIVVSQLGLNFSYLHVQPVAIALFARAAPASLGAMMVGLYYLTMFFGSVICGRLGALYEVLSPTRFWLLHAAIAASGGPLLLLFGRLWPIAEDGDARQAA